MVSQNDKEKTPDSLPLEEVVIALQKTFSRVTQRTKENKDDSVYKTTAMIVGDINFEMTVKVSPEDDCLIFDKIGSIDIKLSGVIDLDISDSVVD